MPAIEIGAVYTSRVGIERIGSAINEGILLIECDRTLDESEAEVFTISKMKSFYGTKDKFHTVHDHTSNTTFVYYNNAIIFQATADEGTLRGTASSAYTLATEFNALIIA